MSETETQPRWRGRGPRAMCEVFPADLPRLNALVERLNSHRTGRHRQKDAIRYLLDLNDQQDSEATP